MLSETVFCPRAGVIACEQQAQDNGDEDPGVAPLGLPRYELHAIERAINVRLEATKRRLRVALALSLPVGAAVGVAASGALWAASERLSIGAGWTGVAGVVGLSLAAAGGLFAWALLPGRGAVAQLMASRDLARGAVADEPKPDTQENQAVNWWSLWRAGFESINYKDALRDESCRLIGRPWRVLRRGSLRIPVFKKRHSDGPKGRQLYRQHYARIGAYCHLLERCEGGESPFGIVLFGDSYDGVAVSRESPGTWVAFRDGLLLTRRVIGDLQAGGAEPGPPEQRSRCRACPLGKPVPVTDPHRRTYRSICGDRFHWTPPHARAVIRRLRRR